MSKLLNSPSNLVLEEYLSLNRTERGDVWFKRIT